MVEHSQAPEIPQALPLQLRDLLSACFRHKAEQRPTPVQLLRLLEMVPLPKQDPPEARPRRPLTPVITEEDIGLAAGSSAALRRSSSAAAAAAAAAAGPMPTPPPATNPRHAMARHLDTGADFAPVPRPLLKMPSMPPTAPAPAAPAGDQSTPQPASAEIQADAAARVSSTKRQRSGAAAAGAAAAAGTNATTKGPAPSDSPAKHVMRLPRLTSAPTGSRSKAKQEEEPALVPVAPLSAALKKKQAQLQAMRASQALQQQAALQAQQEKQRQAEEQAKKKQAEQQAKEAEQAKLAEQAKQQQAKQAKQQQAEQQASVEAEADHAEAQAAAFAAAEAVHTISEVASSSTGKVHSPKGGAATRMPRMTRGTISASPQQQQQQQPSLPPPPAFLQTQGKQGEPASNAASGPLQSLHLSQVAESDRLSAGPESPHTMPPPAAGPGTGAQQQAGDADTDVLMGAGDSLHVPPMTAVSSSQLLPEASDESLSSTRAVASNPEADPSLRAAAKCVTQAADLVEQGELDQAELQLRWVCE